MKKVITIIMATLMSFGCVFAASACSGKNDKYVAKAITGIKEEEYGYCISKTATKHDEILNAINAVIEEVNMEDVVAYYTAKSNDQTPDVTLNFADLSDNTAGTLEIYTTSGFEPYEFIDSDGSTVIGVDMYIMALAAEKLNMKININDVDFEGLVASIAGKDNAVGAAGITINDDRKKSVDFSNPYFSSVQCIISKDSEGYTDFESLKGKKIGVQQGTTGSQLVQKEIESGVLKDTGAQVVEYATGAVAFAAMKQGKCDYVVIDKLPAEKLVR